MVTYRFTGNHSAVRTVMTEKGHRPDNPPRRGKLPGSGGETAASVQPTLSVPDHAPDVPAPLLARNLRRIADLRRVITDSGVVEALVEFTEGRREMTSDQVAAGLALMKKIVPDLANLALPPEDADTEAEDESPKFEIHIVDPKA